MYGPEYLQKYGENMLPSPKKAMDDIQHCRTQVMGGHVSYCEACEEHVYAYHSCGNRHCLKCGDDRADDWRDRQMRKLLPVHDFMVTFTLPHTLNPIAHSNQKGISRLLFQSSAEALQTLALNSECLGGQIGMVGVLHTWDRRMDYHLHGHYLVPAGRIDPTTRQWKPAHPTFLVPGSALRNVFRAKFRDALNTEAPHIFAHVPPETWTTTWNVHCKPVGDGKHALKYLAPSISRIALSNRRLVSLNDGTVIFRYKPRNKPWTTMKFDAMSFIRRFLQQVLPKGFQKVHSFGFLHPNAKTRFHGLKEHLEQHASATNGRPESEQHLELRKRAATRHTPEQPGMDPHCGGPLWYIGKLARRSAIESPLQHQRGPPCTQE